MVTKGPAKKLTIYVDEADKFHGKPVYEILLDIFFKKKIMGVSVFRGIAGYGPHKRYHKKKTLTVHGELPILITIMDSEEKIHKAIPILDELVGEGIVVLSDVNVIKYTHRDAAEVAL